VNQFVVVLFVLLFLCLLQRILSVYIIDFSIEVISLISQHLLDNSLFPGIHMYVHYIIRT